jgi:hypothetical protein
VNRSFKENLAGRNGTTLSLYLFLVLGAHIDTLHDHGLVNRIDLDDLTTLSAVLLSASCDFNQITFANLAFIPSLLSIALDDFRG